jgi:hypothetical protein
MAGMTIPHFNVVICTPGSSMTPSYVRSLLKVTYYMNQNNITWNFMTEYSSHVADARERTLGGSAFNDKTCQKPANGEWTYDKLFWIDSDIEWDPTWIGKLLNYPVDVVGGTYRKKTDGEELYVIKQLVNPAPVDTRTGLMKVDGLGCGFIRLSRRAMQYLWDASEPYQDRGEKRMIFEVLVEDGDILSEDIYMCHKLNRGGIQVHLDRRMCCNHMGLKKYEGNFFDWYQRLLDGLKSKDDEKV